MQQKSQQQQPTEQAANPLDDPQALVQQLRDAYLRDNEREVPSQCAKILYQCFHPLKDKLQALYTKEKVQKGKGPNENGIVEQDPEGAQHDVDDAERSLAYEYVVILEELAPARTHKAKHGKDQEDNVQTLFMSNVQSLHQDSILGGIGEAQKDEGAAVGDEPHRKYPERYRLQATQQASYPARKTVPINTDQIPSLRTPTQKLLMQGEGEGSELPPRNKTRIFDIQTNEADEDDDEDEYSARGVEEEFKFDAQQSALLNLIDIENQDEGEDLDEKIKQMKKRKDDAAKSVNLLGQPSIISYKPTVVVGAPGLTGLPGYGEVQAHRRAWEIFENAYDKDQPGATMPQFLKEIKSKSISLYDVKEPFVLPSYDGENDTVQFKEFKLTLWRINKFQQSRHVLAQQYLTIWGEPDLQVMFKRFSFTCDLKYIYLTFYTPHNDALFKTVVLESTTLEKVEGAEYWYYRNGMDAYSSLKVSDVTVEPVMFRLGPKSSQIICEREDIKSSNFAAQYAMYFHTQEQGMFFMSLGRVPLTYPFTRDFGGIQSGRRNTLDLANTLLSSGEVKNVFFNVEENEAVVEDTMLILLQCKQRSLTSGMDRGDDAYQQVSFSRQGEEDRREVVCPFKVIVVDIAKLLIKMFVGNFDYVDKEDSEFRQVVDITLPNTQFEDMILYKTFYTRKFGIIGQTILKNDVLTSPTAMQLEDPQILLENIVQALTAVDTQYLFQIPLTTMARDVSAEYRISAQIFPMRGGMRLPSNPQLQIRLSLKANSQGLDSRQRNASMQGSYAIYMDDLIFYKGVLGSMIANRRAVYVPKEIENACLFDPDFFLSQETDEQLNLMEINLEDNQASLPQAFANTSAKKGLNSQEDDWENLPAHRSIRPRPTVHYLKPEYQKDPQTREFFIQDTFLADINIKTPDVHFLDPYIITVEDKTQIIVYSSVDPDRYFVYDLELHFELFVELGCPSIVIDDKTYYNHQVSLFLTFDLESNQHRLECLILPSYDQMSHNRQDNMKQVFLHYRFPYMMDFEPEDPLDISTMGDLALTAQLLQIPEKAGYQAGVQKKIYQDVLVMQTQESILIYDLVPFRPCSQRGKYPTYLSQVPMIRANDHVVKSIVCAVPNIQNVIEQDALKKIEKNGYPNIYFAYLNGTDTEPNRPGLYMLKIKSKTIGSPSVSGTTNKEEGDDNTSQQRKSRPYLIYEFPPGSESTEDRILAMSISEKDVEGVSLLIMDTTFTIKLLKLEQKNAQWRLRLVETSIQPIEQIEQIWNRLTFVSHGEGNRPRIILTDHGAYIESHFYAFIPSGSLRAEAQLDFEANRDTKLSQRLKARDGTKTRIWLNGDGVLSSQGQLLMWYRREHTCNHVGLQSDGKKADMLKENLKMSDAMISNRMSIRNQQNLKSRLSIRKMTVKNGGGGNIFQPAPLIPQKPKVSEHHFFLVASEMRSRIKRLMSDRNDAYVRDQVVFTSFIGNLEEDDILVVLKNGRHLIFDNSGRVVRLEATFKFIDVSAKNKVQNRFFGEKELCQFTIVDTLNVMTSKDNFLKLLMLNKETGEYFTAELKLLSPATNGIKTYTIKNTINLQQVSYRIKMNKGNSSGLPRGYDQGPEENEGQEYIIKFDTEGNVGKFVYPEIVKLDSRTQKGFEFKENDFTMTLNLNKDKKINEMIHGIVERSIKSQMSERGRREEQKRKEMMELEEVLLSEEENEEKAYMRFRRADFDFFDLKAQAEMKGVRKQIRYFVFRYKNEIAYQMVITDVEKQKDSKGLTIDNTVSETFKLDLKLRKAGIITQFLPVDNQHHIQFMFYDPSCKRFFLFTWDLQANREVKMLKLEKTQEDPYFQLTRGASLRQNYIVMHGLDEIYDLRLDFSQNFISGQRVWGSRRDFEVDYADQNEMVLSEEEKFKTLLLRQAQSHMHEIKANYDGSFFLGLRKTTQTQIHRGFSLFDLQYIDYILSLYGLESKAFKYQAGTLAQPLILDYLNVQLPFNTNILHLYYRSPYFLSIYLKELADQIQYKQSDPKNPHAEEICPFLYYSLIPLTLTAGVKGKRGLSMALKGSYGECFELMAQMLMLDPCGINYMKHIKHYIIKLLSYDSDIIRNFLQSKCSTQLYTLMLTADQQERYFENYLGTNSEYINLSENEESEQAKGKSRIGNVRRVPIAKRVPGGKGDDGESEDEHQEIERQKRINDELVQQNQAQKKLINLYSYDFDGYLVGERSKLFLSYIVQQDNNLKIFDLNYIKMYLDYQWRKLKNRYFQLLLAYIINNVLMVVYVAMQQIQLSCSQDDYDQHYCQYSLTRFYSDLESKKGLDYVFFIFRFILIAFSIILIYIEFIRQKNSKNFLTTFFLWINIAYVVKQGADIGMEVWFKSLMQKYKPYPLPKDFSEFAADSQTNKDWTARIVRIPIFLIKASNSFFMLALPMQLLYKVRFLPGMSIYLPKFFSAIQQIRDLVVIFITFTFSFLFSYTILSMLDFRMGALENINDLLDPNTDKIDPKYRLIMSIVSPLFGAFSQIMIQLIFCFGIMMIMYMGAAMIKADQKATEEFEQLKLINLARLIVENELLINRKKLYENVHYVVHSDVKKEKIRSAFTIMNAKDQAQREKKLAGGRRQKRQCCAAMMQGKPLELVYDAK